MVSVNLSNAAETLTALAKIRSAAEQQAFISNAGGMPNQQLIESISERIRELLPRDPDLAQILSETNLHIASLIDTPLAWAWANRSRAHILHTMRKSADAEPFFEKAVELFEKVGLSGEAGRTLAVEM